MDSDSEIKAIRKALQNRQAELEELIQQMKSDQLVKSSVFRNLHQELNDIRQKLNEASSSRKK